MHRALITIASLTAGAATAQPFEITSSTIDAGGGTLSSASYSLSGTIGQPDAGQTLSSGSLTLRGGFWTSGSAASRLCADQNSDGLVTPADFNAWIIAFNAGGSSADQNGDGKVLPDDFNAWIFNYNAGC